MDELPYWETINRYLGRLDPGGLQAVICRLCARLLRSRAFENARIRGKYWQVIIDGTQLHSTRGELDGKCMYRIHKRGTAEEYRENYYYVLETKLVLHPGIVVSIMTEFVENTDGTEEGKQDCERKACWRLMGRLKKEFPRLPICLCADSLYACERFFRECKRKGWQYILRFKEGSIPYIAGEYRTLKGLGGDSWEEKQENGKNCYSYVTGIDYRGYGINVVEYVENREKEIKKGKKKGETVKINQEFLFLTGLPVSRKNAAVLVSEGRRRWKTENEGFNTQKRQGYNLEHLYSKNYQGIKNHYYLIQIGHMVSQVMEAWEKIWEGVRQSREQKHRRMLESLKKEPLETYRGEIMKKIQIRLI